MSSVLKYNLSIPPSCAQTIAHVWAIAGVLSPFPDTDVTVPSLFPQPCTIRHAVEHYFNIAGMPRRYFFELLSFFASSELEKEKLMEFASTEGQVCALSIFTLQWLYAGIYFLQEELFSYCYRPRRTTLEVIHSLVSNLKQAWNGDTWWCSRFFKTFLVLVETSRLSISSISLDRFNHEPSP